MTEELDSTQTEGTQGSQPKGSGVSGSGGSFDPAKLQEAFDSLSKRLEEIDQRTRSLQGDKDRAVNKTRAELEAVKKQLAEIDRLKKLGLSEDEAMEEFAYRQSRNQQPQTSVLVGNEAVKVEEVIEEYGLDITNPEVKLAFEKKFKSREEAELTAARLLKPKPTPTQAQAPATPAQSTAPSGDLEKSYKKDLESLLKQFNGRPNPAQISDLKASYRRKGLEVW